MQTLLYSIGLTLMLFIVGALLGEGVTTLFKRLIEVWKQ